jgi:hypothetical protein
MSIEPPYNEQKDREKTVADESGIRGDDSFQGDDALQHGAPPACYCSSQVFQSKAAPRIAKKNRVGRTTRFIFGIRELTGCGKHFMHLPVVHAELFQAGNEWMPTPLGFRKQRAGFVVILILDDRGSKFVYDKITVFQVGIRATFFDFQVKRFFLDDLGYITAGAAGDHYHNKVARFL